MEVTGGCLCGDVRYRARGDSRWMGHCHCVWCRRQSGAAFASFVCFDRDDVAYTTGAPTIYHASAEVERGFCVRCGSFLMMARPGRGEVFLLAGSLDDPDALVPKEHIFTDHQVAWLRLDDRLPRHGRFPPGEGDREPD